MKTIYLASPTKATLITDIRKVAPDYNGETDYSIDGGGIHFIGDIPVNTYDEETGELISSVPSGVEHANVYVPDDFDETIFETRMSFPPKNPVNKLYTCS